MAMFYLSLWCTQEWQGWSVRSNGKEKWEEVYEEICGKCSQSSRCRRTDHITVLTFATERCMRVGAVHNSARRAGTGQG